MLTVSEIDKKGVESLINATLQLLYEQQQCGIETVSTKIEIGALEEIRQRIIKLGNE